jgi:hypothetical protein
MSDDFDSSAYRDDVVIAHQAPIAVYTNPGDNIVIRQDGDWYRKEDPWIVGRRENARALAEAILAFAEPELAPVPLALPAPMTPAERTKRYRERKRHDRVTPQRDGGLFQAAEVPASD